MEIKLLNLADLFRHESEFHAVSAGSPLFREGETGSEMYVQMSGTADIFVHDRLVEKTSAGAILGEMALIDSSPRAATVIATSDCRFAVVTAKRFNFLVQQTPNFSLHVMRVMAGRLRNADSFL